MSERLPQDMLQEAKGLLDESVARGYGGPEAAAKRDLILANLRANPALLPAFLESMKRRLAEL